MLWNSEAMERTCEPLTCSPACYHLHYCHSSDALGDNCYAHMMYLVCKASLYVVLYLIYKCELNVYRYVAHSFVGYETELDLFKNRALSYSYSTDKTCFGTAVMKKLRESSLFYYHVHFFNSSSPFSISRSGIISLLLYIPTT